MSINSDLIYGYFKRCPWISKVKFMDEVKFAGLIVDPPFYRLKSLLYHVNRSSRSWDMAISKLDPKHTNSKSWVKVQGHIVCPISYHIHFMPCHLAFPFLIYSYFKIWPWKSKVKVMGEAKVQGHKVDQNLIGLYPFCFMLIPTPFSKFDFENPRSRSYDQISSSHGWPSIH